MPYTPDPTSTTQPDGSVKASTAALEFTALKAYIQNTIIPSIAAASTGKVAKAGDTLTGTLTTTTVDEGHRIARDTGLYSGWNTANTVRTGYLQFNVAASAVALAADAANTIQLTFPGLAALLFTRATKAFTPDSANNAQLGTAALPFSHVYAGQFHGDGSLLTGISSGSTPPTSAQIIAALGYTPYNSANPNGYISGITSSMVSSALGYTPYNSNNPNGYISGINAGMVNSAYGFAIGNNAYQNRTVTTSGSPSGGSDGDIWYQVV